MLRVAAGEPWQRALVGADDGPSGGGRPHRNRGPTCRQSQDLTPQLPTTSRHRQGKLISLVVVYSLLCFYGVSKCQRNPFLHRAAVWFTSLLQQLCRRQLWRRWGRFYSLRLGKRGMERHRPAAVKRARDPPPAQVFTLYVVGVHKHFALVRKVMGHPEPTALAPLLPKVAQPVQGRVQLVGGQPASPHVAHAPLPGTQTRAFETRAGGG
mmetsp:Transcript_44419/g.82172  ORF Transcript_44419/g.82172 Transcript_44419/m.82172 type:complete len:210 (-) Transcript_44419:454-1083(-)